MGTTPRNELALPDWRRDVSYAKCMDTLYEVADAELTSDKQAHELWAEGNKPRIKWYFRQQLKMINMRDELRIDGADRDVICERIYNDWKESHER